MANMKDDMNDMDHSKMDHMDHDMNGMDHSKMNHDMSSMDHSKMGHHDMSGMDHSKMDHMDMSGMDHDNMDMGGDMMMHGGQMMHMGNLKQKFWVSVVLAIPVLLLAPIMGLNVSILNFHAPLIEGIVILLFDTALYFYGGAPFLKGAGAEVKSKAPAMMTLITLGISVSYFYSIYAFIANNFLNPATHVMDFSFELATLILIMLLGHWLEMNAVMGAGDAVEKMAALLPKTAHLVTDDGQTKDVEVSDLQVGQKFQVRSGESIPADGTIINGQSTVNEALVTGESAAVTKNVGDKVIGGATNNNGTLTVEITGTGESGYLSQVMKMVQEAQKSKSKAEDRADLVAKYLFYAAVSVGIIAFFAWLPQGLSVGLTRMVTVFVIACPHALGVAIPLVVARSTSIGAQNGLLVRNRQAIEASQHISHVLLDKTGTLTEGKFTVNALVPNDGVDETSLLSDLAALESNSTHPLAQAILAKAEEKGVQVIAAEKSQNIPGVGISGEINGTTYTIVNGNYLTKNGFKFDTTVADQWAAKGNSVSFLLSDNQVLGMVAEGDTIKPGAKALIAGLKKRGITPVMLTGDNQKAAEHVADLLGLDEFHAGLLPDDKQKIVGDYQAKGNHVMMVGDGVNDAPSLAEANIGVAIGAGTDVAIDSADVILVKSEPSDILHFLDLAKITNRKMVQNLWWGAGYNIVAIPLAAGILAFAGIILDPAVGAAVMAMSTIIVALNAMGLTAEKIQNN
ncbi:Copper-exporting P-type ATPase B [Lentilactobacillus parabuchneri]|nr:heavy metal translocating P-type ATPase [Lentilactobacillus parabuchneri]MBW0222225.1 copper-translocating P-type ATPase [Lentilactobacillus parabuchneri]MBW0245538.1 copper-translocating P-type ATPase [Lentilactobacillus parabuchneri]MBW0263606.1 copper-translocating P-type ATPase [Lentilactobacillus parabuchneri]MCT2884187.1 copper-translocating P-type ATPase [Lentilactobacillus parabuchneri]MDG9737594.1 copper-translocating P-type ATPase [Lentilactobacillus parabuchneri]